MSRTFRPRIQRELLNQLSKRRRPSSGFTLVELMIVVAVVGILAAVALPQYLRARDAAAAGSIVGEAIGLAKECAVVAASDIQTGITTPGAGSNVTNGCDETGGGGDIVGTMPAGQTMPAGIRCLDQVSTDGLTTVTASVDADGGLTCAFGGGGGTP